MWRPSYKVYEELTKVRPLLEKALGRDIGPELISVSIREVCERVTAAEAEVERLQRKPPKHNSPGSCLVCDLEAEVERLRAALSRITGDAAYHGVRIQRIAKRALEPEVPADEAEN